MEIEIPQWLTKDFIKHALEDKKEGVTITVDNIEVDKPIAKGDNYMCEIFRVKVEHRTSDDTPEETSLIVKAPIKSEMHEIMKKMGILQKEARIYNEFIPRLDRILGTPNTLTPISYYSDEENVLVLEDLKFQGFVMADRQKQLDFDHCVVALKTLAIYHAASVKIYDEEPEFIKDVGKELFFNKDVQNTTQDFAKFSFNAMAAQCKKLPDLSKYTEAFENYAENAWPLMMNMTNYKDNQFNVLNHGDFWVNNMLFRYENDKPVDLKLIDLQVARYTTPATDLLYFLYASVQEDLRLERTEELLSIYLKELNRNLEKFGTSQRLSESELKIMMENSEFFGLFVSISLFPIVIADPKECGVLEMKEMKMEDLQDMSNHPFSMFCRSKKFVEILTKRLSEFETKGLL